MDIMLLAAYLKTHLIFQIFQNSLKFPKFSKEYQVPTDIHTVLVLQIFQESGICDQGAFRISY